MEILQKEFGLGNIKVEIKVDVHIMSNIQLDKSLEFALKKLPLVEK